MFRLYVDEVGTDDLTHTEKDKHRYLSLTGVAMRVDYARDQLTPNMNLIKSKIFDHDPDVSPIIFHRTDIMGFNGTYECLRDEEKRAKFDKAILALMERSEYTVITALIDKKWMLGQRHWKKTHPYHYLMEILVEKYAQFLERKGSIGDIMPEARLGPKDKQLQQAFEIVKEDGTQYLSGKRIQSVIRANNLKFRTKKDNIAGLQLCDLIAHPSHIYTRLRMGDNVNPGRFCSSVVEILVSAKYDRSVYGKVTGYGIKHLP